MSTAILTPSAEQLARFTEAQAERSQRQSPLFMVIDDQLLALEMMKRAMAGQHLLQCDRAVEGFQMYLQNAPDVLWLDMGLPEISGLQLAEKVNQIDPHAYIVMVTANEVGDQGANAKHAGAKGFITKPFSKMLINQHIQKFIKEDPRYQTAIAG